MWIAFIDLWLWPVWIFIVIIIHHTHDNIFCMMEENFNENYRMIWATHSHIMWPMLVRCRWQRSPKKEEFIGKFFFSVLVLWLHWVCKREEEGEAFAINYTLCWCMEHWKAFTTPVCLSVAFNVILLRERDRERENQVPDYNHNSIGISTFPYTNDNRT